MADADNAVRADGIDNRVIYGGNDGRIHWFEDGHLTYDIPKIGSITARPIERTKYAELTQDAGLTLPVTLGTFVSPDHLCPDLLRYEQIGAADNWRGRTVRAFFFVMRLWRVADARSHR